MKHNLLKSVIISVILLMGVSNAWASNGSEGTSITVYTSGELFGSAWDTSKSYIKIHVRRGTDDWMNYATMTETGKTYNDKKIYSYTFKEKWDGAQIYFEHWKTGSGSRISEYGTDWANTSTLNGKLYLGYMDNGHRWATLCYDATIYFLKNGKASSWTTLKAHAWNEGYSSVTTTWPGTTMTNTQKTYDGNPIYSVTFSNPPYSKVIFNQGNNTNQSGEQTIPDHEGKIFDYDANKWIDYTYDVTVTFKANGGTSSDYTQIVKYNTSTTLTANKFTRTGYSFNGWKTAANSGTSYENQASVKFTANTTLYAQWTPAKYTITYKDQNNATFSGSHATGYPTQHTYGTETTLSTATKTGYTFEGWYKEPTCTNKVTSLGATAYTANITLYAKWTEKPKYTVTISSDGNGTVSPIGNQQVGEIPVSIKATANDGYKFTNWTKTGNVTIDNANSASTTITATGTGTVTANFEKQSRIYLKPAGDNNWANGTPRYAVYVIDDETWHNMTKINDGDSDAGNDIYYCDIKPTYQKVIFCRMDPNNATNGWDGIRWTQTEDLTLPDNCNLFDIAKDASTEKDVKATGTWMEYNAWHLAGDFNEWALCGQTFKEQEDGSFTFTQHLELGTYQFKLLHNGDWYGNNGTMVRGTSTGWTMSTSDNNCNITADYAGDYIFTFNANTKQLTVTYPTAYKMTFGIDNAAHGTLKVQINYENAESGKYWHPGTKFVFSYEINKGYLFKGWNTKQNGTGEWLSTDITYTHTLTEDTTVYAIFEDGYHITVGSTTYYFIDHNGKQINKLYIELGKKTTYNSPLYKGTTKVDDGGTHTSTVAGTYTCELNDATDPTGVNWTPPYADGDYRLLYIEQEVGLEGGLPKTTITYSHPSDIVRKSNTSSENVVSLHIFNKMDGSMDAGGKLKTGLNSPEIILQQYNALNDTWEDIACHMIFGPLRAGFMHAGMPGRKNASPNSSIDDLLYDNGIEVIKKDQIDNGSGVWDFTVYQDGTTATLDLRERGLKRYTGKYYIRTSAAKGQWSNYTIPENEMTESRYASDHFRLNNPYHEENEYFTHSFCEYVNKTITSNVKFVVANEHGMAISKEFTKDDFTDAEGNLAGANTNVRWSWNQITNKCKRAYIAGSFDGDNEFLVVKKENDNVELQPNTNGKTGYFNDNTNWLYYADVNSKPLAKVQVAAKYNNKYQYFMGAESGENQFEQLIGGTASNTKYPVRIIYDFKEHRFVVAYLPQNTITGDVAIETSVMLLRTNHGETNQIVLNDAKKITAPVPAYGAITFTEQHLTGSGSQYEKMLYWVSFPFDVALPDVFGLGKYGTDWIMEYYDGEARSITGLTTYNTFWKYITDETETLKAGVGYVLCLNVNKVNEHFLDTKNKNEEVTLYFPSKESIPWGDITKQGEKTISLTKTTNSVSSETDHNWHLIGVPSYANTGESANTDNTDFLYQYDATDNSYDAKASEGVNFQALHAYMVQHAGDIRWTNYIAPSPIAARNNTDAVTHTLRLELQDNGSYADQTFIKLTDEENPTLDFDMNRDLPKIINTGANVYSLIQERNIQLAGNVMPVANTTIPLGVVIAAAGEYTFAMPDGTDGIVVELIDYEANTTTNLLFNDYTVSLPKGTFENRFALSVKPDKTATSLENIFNEATGDEVKKYIIDGVLYMQKDGVLYDAQGHIVR